MIANVIYRGGSRGGRTGRAPPPPKKIGKNKIFLAQYRDFSHEIPHKFSRLPPKLEKMIFLRKIVIFHTKYPNNFSASLRSSQFVLSAPPLKWNPGSVLDLGLIISRI